MQDKKPLSPENVMIYRLISTNKLLSDTISAQQRENELLTLKMSGWLDWERHRKKFTNKKYLRKEH